MNDLLIILAIVAVVAFVGYLIFRPSRASTRAQNAEDAIRTHQVSTGRRIYRRGSDWVYDDGSLITDLILLDILSDGELDFNFVPEYAEAADFSDHIVERGSPMSDTVADEQVWEKSGELEMRDKPEVPFEPAPQRTTYTPDPEPSYGGDSNSGGDFGGGSSDD